MKPSPTTTPESPLSGVVERNIDALLATRQEALARRTFTERAVDAFTDFAGSMAFAALHLVFFGLWFVANTGHLGLRPWDPYPFVMLSVVTGVEAIFLSTFVLMGQKRQSLAADRRADLDLQVNLLAEHESTRVVAMVEAIARKMGIDVSTPDLEELKADIAPEAVVRQIERHEAESAQP